MTNSVDESSNTGLAAAARSVSGKVVRHDGSPVVAAVITAAGRRLRSQTAIGDTTTGADGGYRLDYPAQGGPFDLVVSATVDGQAIDVVRPDAGVREVVDFRLPGQDPTEYAGLLAEVTPLLEGVALADLTEDDQHHDVTYLARATGKDAIRVGFLSLAHRHAAATGLAAEQFYGALRQGLPPDLSAMAQRPVAEIRAAIVAAVDAKVIAPASDGVDFADRLRDLEVAATVNPVDGVAPSPLGEIFALTISDPDTRERVYNAYLDRTGGRDSFWADVRQDKTINGDIERLERALTLATMTGNNVALVRAVLAKFDSNELSRPADVAKLHDEWPTLVAQTGGVPRPVVSALEISGQHGDVAAEYVDTIRGRVAEAHPTAALAYQLSVHPAHASAPATTFLSQHPEFDLVGTPVNATTVPDSAARSELGDIQRTFKITNRFESMQALRDNGFTSSYSIASIGRDRFARRLGEAVSTEEAATIHARATRVHANAVNLVADIRTAGQFSVPWLPDVQPATAQVPNWTELFGSADYCACPDCRTVYSEAAYLVDLLYYLQRLGIGGAVASGTDPWANDPLYLRRPDIWDVQLSCDNTNLSLPYIDLVNELLESAVSPATAIDATQRQTSGDQTQLRVQPQHVNAGAYDKLRAAVYPWDLPFDLWDEQTKDYLGSLGVGRVDLLTALALDNEPTKVYERLGLNLVQAQIIAGESLTPPRVLAEFYGEPATTTDAAVVASMQAVPALLRTADMVYADLVALLESRFVNPGGLLRIAGNNTTTPCDVSTFSVLGLDAPALDRIHRFVRLQRALGWSTAALDRALHASNNNGLLDATTLRCLAGLIELAQRLGLAVDDVLCFYAPLETYNYPSENALAQYDQLFLNTSVVTPRPGVANPFQLNADGTELAVAADLADPVVTAALLAVLQVNDDELTQLTVGPRAVITETSLDLAELATLVRTVRLARALGLSVSDLLRLIELAGGRGPFAATPAGEFVTAHTESELAGGLPMLPDAHPRLIGNAHLAGPELFSGLPMVLEDHTESAASLLSTDKLIAITEWFVDAVRAITANGLAVADLDAVLADTVATQGGVIPDDATLAATLTTLRAGLQAVYQQTAQVTDAKGDLTRKDLSLLGWDATVVQDAVSNLLGTVTYTQPLTTLPAGVVFPADIPIRFEAVDSTTGQLVLVGPMTVQQLNTLTGLSSDSSYLGAVQALFLAPRTFVATKMKTLVPQIYSAPLAAWPTDVQLPTSLVGNVFFDASQQLLCTRIYLTDNDITTLSGASADPRWHPAVTQLATAEQAPPGPGNALFTSADAAALFDTDVAPADRFQRVLAIVAPYLRRTLSETTVKQQLGQATGLDAASADLLLTTWLYSPTQPDVLADFLTPDYVGSDPSVALTRTGFPEQFTMLELLHRVALLVNRLRITAKEIPFVFAQFAPLFDQLPLLPVSGSSPLFAGLIDLLGLIRLRGEIPGGIVKTIAPLFASAASTGATLAGVESELAALTGWNAADVHTLGAMLDLSTPIGFTELDNLRALADAIGLLARLGVSADRTAQWLLPQVSSDAAQAAWSAAKAQHSLTDWPSVAAPLQDGIRTRQRDALVSYLLANPLLDTSGSPQWIDVDGLHDYFLIDVEMGASQQTTRIAQAIFSVQLFVQRCLLNLEAPVPSGDDDIWAQWEWMQQYQLWVANQKVFLYPENYFEPDLRADATPIFTGLQNEIMQKDVTDANLETALEHYIEGLGTVARLRPCAVYRHPDVNAKDIYLVARTETAPVSYYFRVWANNRSYWTPWQKIDLDIQSEVVLPAIMNNTLYLVWPTFIQAADAETLNNMPSSTNPMSAPTPYWKISLNWSKYVNGKWLAKRTSDTLVTTDGRQATFADLTKFRFYVNEDDNDDLLQIEAIYNQFFPSGQSDNSDYIFDTLMQVFMGREQATGDVFGAEVTSGSPPPDLTTPEAQPTGTTTYYNEFLQTVGWDNGLWIPNPAGTANTPQWWDTTMVQALQTVPFGGTSNRILYPNLSFSYDDWTSLSLTYTDDRRSYILEPVQLTTPAASLTKSPAVRKTRDKFGSGTFALADARSALGAVTPADASSPWYVRFHSSYHPHVETFIVRLDQAGLDGLFSRDLQLLPGGDSFQDYYSPNSAVVIGPYPGPGEPIEFEFAAAYSLYNWELFFHAPLLAAERLSTNQAFADAQQWFHRIFNPTDRSGGASPQRYWQTKPFFQTTAADYLAQRIENILHGVATGDNAQSQAVEAWLENPFQPDVVAQLRTTAYQKAVVMKYLDNLIAWGDQLFAQDTLESVNQATQLYILADELLGPRPDEVSGQGETATTSYRQLQTSTTAVAAAVTAAENILPAPAGVISPAIAPGLGLNWLNYFSVPRNEKLIGYWDTVTDRLFKVRNGLTLQGGVNAASAFGSPIDPSLLVKATAAGVSLASALADISAPLPYYRFGTMLAKAKEFAGEVKAFGAALLSALEKRDAEALARLRSGNELSVLIAARAVKAQQVQDAIDGLNALQQSKVIAQQKYDYYHSRTLLNAGETVHTLLTRIAVDQQGLAADIDMAASLIGYLPDLKIGFPTTIGATWGSSNIIAALKGMSGSLISNANINNMQGSLAATLGGYHRRMDDWQFQAQQATGEITQLESQIAAAQVRAQIALTELDNHDTQIGNAKAENQFLYDKYTNEELYDWLVGQLSTSYFQAYQLAYDLAKRAERAYRHELGLDDSSFIQFGYWDGLHSGLLAGERLATDLNRLDASYLELNARELELTKRISLAQLDPNALLRLKETGSCFVSLPEAIFDLDTPGHYFRRLKNVSITVPCVAGPYTGVNLTATLLGSTVRVSSLLNSKNQYARQQGDTRFRDQNGPIESIVTSTGQDDTGLFEPNLRDERFLPFEGAGVVGEWQLSLPKKFRQFDYESITDVVLHLRYTARDGGIGLADQAVSELAAAVNAWVHGDGSNSLYRTFSIRREYADQWNGLLNPNPGTAPTMTFTMAKNRFPYLFRDEHITAGKPEFVLVLSRDLVPGETRRYVDAYPTGQAPLTVAVTPPGGTSVSATLQADPSLDGTPRVGFDQISTKVQDTPQDWVISLTNVSQLDPVLLTTDGRLNPDAVVDVLLVWQYTLED